MNSNSKILLPVIEIEQIDIARPDPLDEKTLEKTSTILAAVRSRKDEAVREYAVKFGDIQAGQPLVIDRHEMERTANALPAGQLELLERVASRIRKFAQKQLDCLRELDTTVDSGRAGHSNIPVDSAGCYAPGGRFPLPSSVLMTVIPAKVAGVKNIWVASPRPAPITIAAAAVAGADALLAVGGAQAIAALAYGTEKVPACDVIVGPGNRWVTAAKMLIAGRVKIDMLAGPSELVVVADKSADPKIAALDLLAQAEHDTDALPILITDDDNVIPRVRNELLRFLESDPTDTALKSLQNGFALKLNDIGEAVDVVNRIAPEHLQLSVENPKSLISGLKNYGALFIGEQSAEVFGDYGVGPNHVLPTSGGSRRTGGLSVTFFMRQPTWLEIRESAELKNIARDSAELAELEGLKWHARAAKVRLP